MSNNNYYNRLSPAEAERLAMLAEECGEVIQIIGKILRHGYDSHSPADRLCRSNRTLLAREMTDVQAIWREMEKRDGVGGVFVMELDDAWQRKLIYAHHQQPDDDECCVACGEPLQASDMVYYEHGEGGHIHAACCGPERESYCDEDGAPLAPEAPIPQPFAYERDAP